MSIPTDHPDLLPGALWKHTGRVNFAVSRILEVDATHVSFSSLGEDRTERMPRFQFLDLHAAAPALNRPDLILAGTGHRPEHIASKNVSVWDTRTKVFNRLVAFLKDLQPKFVISGLAKGFDLWLGWAAVTVGIPVVGAIPYPEQSFGWDPADRTEYDQLLVHIPPERRIVLSPRYWKTDPYDGDDDCAYKLRNRWMVDQSHMIISVFRGRMGGTWKCLEYARLRDRPRLLINNPDLLP